MQVFFQISPIVGGPPRSGINIFADHPTSFKKIFCIVQTLNWVKIYSFFILYAFVADKVDF